AGEVRDTALKVPPGVEGTVIEARVFSRKGVSKDERSREIEEEEVARLVKDEGDQVRILRESTARKVKELVVGKVASGKLADDHRRQLLAKGQEITAEDIDENIPSMLWGDIRIGDDKSEEELEGTCRAMRDQIDHLRGVTEEKKSRLQGGDELSPGVIKLVKVFVAIKRKLQVGDKMAGRHGNKGVLSRILPEEDMPYLADGTPVDIVLNPLGVPSRMNVGQILETHLGFAARQLGLQVAEALEAFRQSGAEDELRSKLSDAYGPEFEDVFASASAQDLERVASKATRGIHTATPVFDGASEEEIFGLLEKAGLSDTGQSWLFDGKTGDRFSQPVTVGIIYMLKLHHLVDDKIHARSTGPYSLVTQQPLGGKAQFGGQRLGEMEVWALEAYGAAYTLQEMLTVKSDDVIGRTRMYEAIVKGETVLEPGLPESFNVMLKELQSLALDVELIEEEAPVLDAAEPQE
ncbi:MAG: DNA-directed RNA polymerase subunit beta, partial [Candidatus Binatia bacterium]|nr:DNA-directed RNA polymerase subunit beta [Candidatus Binatia bacterium]